VIDARDVLENPRALLAKLCAAFGLEWRESMLAWPPGRRATDGVWAKHWYAEVEKSTGFERHRARPGELPPALARVHEECLVPYRALHDLCLTA
jgi:hypothetical protein